MQILILANHGIGLYKFRRELMTRLCDEHTVYIALPETEFIPELKELGCIYIKTEFERRGVNPFADLKLIQTYKHLIKKLKPDVVLSYTIKPNVYGGIACLQTKTPYIANITGLGTAMENGGILSHITKTLYKTGLKKAHCVFFQNEHNRELFFKHRLLNPTAHTRLIPGSGVNLESNTVEEYPTDDSQVRFLFVGRIMKDKGIDELLEAIYLIKKDYPNASLDIVGECEESYEPVLRRHEKEGLLKYHGFQKDVHKFYKEAHCVILPSYHEGMANVLLEAAATGRPVIATNIPGCAETFDEGITGFGCEPKRSISLAKAMNSFMKLSNEDRRQMGISGRMKVEKEFDRNIVLDRYFEEINKIKKKYKEK